MWFDPQLVVSNASKNSRAGHTLACKTITGGEWPPLCEMCLVDQDYVLECAHPAHDAVKFMFKHWSDAPLNQNIEEGKLF